MEIKEVIFETGNIYTDEDLGKCDCKFVKQTNILEEPAFQDWYVTTLNGNYISDSGSHNYEKALEKYKKIVANAGITKMTEILFENDFE